MKATSPYLCKVLESIDDELIPWGCGVVIKDIPMSSLSRCKVFYIADYLYFLDLSFSFRAFDNHFEMHYRCMLSTKGEDFLARTISTLK